MRTLGRWSLAAILATAAMGALTFGAAAQNRQFSFAYDQPKGSGYDAAADMFNNKLMELSKGTLSINKYPGAQLGTEAQTMQKVQTGDIDFVFLSTANASTAQPESGVSFYLQWREPGDEGIGRSVSDRGDAPRLRRQARRRAHDQPRLAGTAPSQRHEGGADGRRPRGRRRSWRRKGRASPRSLSD